MNMHDFNENKNLKSTENLFLKPLEKNFFDER